MQPLSADGRRRLAAKQEYSRGGEGDPRKCSMVNVQLSFVIYGGASRIFFLKDAAPKAPPKMTNDK
jgi:hypothetical protein